MLANTQLSDKIPSVIENGNGAQQSVLQTSHVLGEPIQDDKVDNSYMKKLGHMLKIVHSVNIDLVGFGSFDASLNIQNIAETFPAFLSWKVTQWNHWHSTQVESDLANQYFSMLLKSIQPLEKFSSQFAAIFCHGDYDTKNIHQTNGEIAGIVDWEHSGMFCLSWELRKLFRFFEKQESFFTSFLTGYDEHQTLSTEHLFRMTKLMAQIDLLGHLRWCMASNNAIQLSNTKGKMTLILEGGIK